ncbi:MAG TPA: phospholipid carrier-dependent glycosyltransferase, partial [Pirellulales bacterium]|nr:phospholipid carrier-dependent glycosyltransferase [Pirellulales bacterium]
MDARLQHGDESSLAGGGAAPAAKSGASISLVLPVLDAEKSLARIVLAANEALARVTGDYEIVLVDGGSHDGTLAVATATGSMFPALRVLEQPALGPGNQVRAGIHAATKDYVALAATNTILEAHDLERLVLVAPHCHLASGTAGHEHDGWIHRLLLRTYNVAADVLLATGVRDSQSAVKFARRDTMRALAPAAESAFLHTEMLSNARRTGLSVVEVDLASRRGGTAVDAYALRNSAATIREAARFWWTTCMFPAPDAPDKADDQAAGAIRSWHIALLTAVAAIVMFTRLTFPLIEPDEARYALIAASMIDSGDLLVPQREGSFYLDKPPLLYWMTVASFWAFGVHDYAARTVTALAGLGTLLATYFAGRHLVGRRGAYLGAFLLLLCLGFVLASRFLIMDGLLTLFTTVTILSMYLATQRGELRRGWWMLAAISCGLGVMTKGPIALVLTLPPWVAARWLAHEGAAVRPRDWLWFGGGVAGVALPWFVAVSIREPGFLRYFFWEHHVVRYTTNMIHVEPWWFYIPVLAIGMFPACVLLPVLAVYIGRRTKMVAESRTRAQGYLLLSALWTVGFFSIGTGKLATYILPALPMLCLLMGAMLDRAILTNIDDKFMARMRLWIPFHGTRLALLAGIVLGIVDFIIDGGEADQWLECALLVFGSAALYWYVSRRTFAERPARWYFAAAVPLAVLAIGIADIYPTIATKRSLATRVAASRHAAGDELAPVICFGRHEDSLL